MKPANDDTRQELNKLLACVTALRQIDGAANKGPYLVLALQREPCIAKYFRWLIQAPQPDDAPLLLAREIPNLPPELADIARRVCDRTLAVGATPALIAKALERSRAEVVNGRLKDLDAEDITILIRVATPVGGTAAGSMLIGGRPFANLSFRVGPAMQAGIARLKQLGVLFEGESK